MPYTIHTAKAKIRDAQNHYRDIDVFSDDLEEALEAIGRDNNSGARGAAVAAVQTIADNINTSTANQLTDASAVANMVAQQFNAANAYKSGDYVRYTTTSNNTTINKLYRLTADHAANVTWENTSKVEVNLSNDVVGLKNAVRNNPIEWTVTNGYITTANAKCNPSSPTSSQNFNAAVVSCSEGDVFTVNGKSGQNGRLWAFIDDATPANVIARETNTSDIISDMVITAPKGTSYLVVNNQKSVTPNAVSYYGELTALKLERIENDLIKSQGETVYSTLNYAKFAVKHMCCTILSSGSAVSDPYATDNFYTISISCAEGDTFELVGTSTQNSGLWAFVNASGVVLSRNAPTNYSATSPIQISAPENTSRLIVNFGTATYNTSYIVKVGANIVRTEKELAIVHETVKDGRYSTYDLTPQFMANKAIVIPSTNADPHTIGTSYNSPNYDLLIADCVPGDVFEIRAYNSAGVSQRTYAFVDASNNVLSYNKNTAFGADTYDMPVRVAAPADAAKIIVNAYKNGYPDYYVVKLGKYANIAPTYANYNTQKYQFMFPRLPDVYDFVERSYQKTQDFADFNTLYQAFHALNVSGFIEEINMSTDYLANNTDEIPTYISNITNGGMYMWHVLPPATDGSTYDVKGKRTKVLLTSGVHGGEKKSIWDLYYLLKDIHDNASEKAAVTLRNFVDLYIIPLECPYGIENNTRESYGDVNPNRDFWNPHWSKQPDSGLTYNQLYETRCTSWWIEQLAPDIVSDHHTSTGDNSIENGKFLAWGASAIGEINSLIEQVITQLSPMVRTEYPALFGNYNWVYGHTQNISDYINYGTLQLFAYFKGAISANFEVVLGVKWDGTTVISSGDADQTALMTIDNCFYRNYIMAFINEGIKILNSQVRY